MTTERSIAGCLKEACWKTEDPGYDSSNSYTHTPMIQTYGLNNSDISTQYT